MARKIKNLYLALERVVRVLPPPSFLLLLSLSLSRVSFQSPTPVLFAFCPPSSVSLSLFLLLTLQFAPSRKIVYIQPVARALSLECTRLDSIKFIAINDN